MIGGGSADRAREFFRIVAENAEVGDLRAETREQTLEQAAVGIIKRSARQQ